MAQGIFFDSSHGEPEMVDDLLQLARSLDEQEPVEIVNMPQSIGTIASAGAIAFRALDGSRIEEILEKRQLSSRSHVENSGVVFRYKSAYTLVQTYCEQWWRYRELNQ